MAYQMQGKNTPMAQLSLGRVLFTNFSNAAFDDAFNHGVELVWCMRSALLWHVNLVERVGL